jgi:hypothetical protein
MPNSPAPNTALARSEPDSLSQALDASLFEALALDRQPNGYTASIFLGLDANGVGKWTDRVWGASASDAVRKALAGMPVVQEVASAPVLAPPPY